MPLKKVNIKYENIKQLKQNVFKIQQYCNDLCV